MASRWRACCWRRAASGSRSSWRSRWAASSPTCCGGGELRIAFAFTCANVVEALVAYRLMAGIGRQEGRQAESLFTIGAIARFCLAVVVAATVSATIACLLSGRGFALMFLSWQFTVALGIMIVVPLIMNFMQAAARREHKGMTLRELVRTAVVLALIAVTAVGVFAQTTYPLLFLPLLGVLVATYFLGPTGATCSTLIIAVIGSYAAWRNSAAITSGPADPTGTVLFFQFYLFVLLASSLPLAALIAMRDRSFAEVERGKRWLEMSENISKVGHWRLELGSMRLFWSSEIFRIHGLVPGDAPTVESAIDFYHPDDRMIVRNSLEDCLERKEPMSFEARILRSDGECRHIYSRSELERLDDGTPVAIFGIFQDVTARVLVAMELSSARADAEARAVEAIALAETDPLTGIANRRKVFSVLEAEVERAETQGTELSIAVLDIDRFKQVNDRFGHAVGDQVIRRIAQICAMMIRTCDFVGRIGGEEFVIVLSGMGPDMAVAVAERMRRAIENEDWTALEIDRVTASIGLACHAPEMDRDQLLARADGALYRAKQDGRNRLRRAA
ncbi:diguanylate cyclase [Novosphingobium sp. BL-8H]|uniref:GGDEF domain-containing protein n=1 Tax=Novosphingobium sp. BL-8H TaxID=3127640 RepID=UPI003756FF1A